MNIGNCLCRTLLLRILLSSGCFFGSLTEHQGSKAHQVHPCDVPAHGDRRDHCCNFDVRVSRAVVFLLWMALIVFTTVVSVFVGPD